MTHLLKRKELNLNEYCFFIHPVCYNQILLMLLMVLTLLQFCSGCTLKLFFSEDYSRPGCWQFNRLRTQPKLCFFFVLVIKFKHSNEEKIRHLSLCRKCHIHYHLLINSFFARSKIINTLIYFILNFYKIIKKPMNKLTIEGNQKKFKKRKI